MPRVAEPRDTGTERDAAASRLDPVTKLDHRRETASKRRVEPVDGAWSLNVYPDVGEAVIFYSPERDEWGRAGYQERRRPNDPPQPRQEALALVRLDVDHDHHVQAWQRRRESARVAAARSRTTVRRFMVQNLMDRMWTFTVGCRRCRPHQRGGGCTCEAGPDRPTGPAGRRWIVNEARGMVRRLKRALGGDSFPYLYVPEPHQDGSWHLHLFLNRWVDADVVRGIWHHGYVDGRRWRHRGRKSLRANARLAAAYASKYAAKGWEAVGIRESGDHRYERAQGFAVRMVRRRRLDMMGALWTGAQLLDTSWRLVWDSEQCEDWRAPPVMILAATDT